MTAQQELQQEKQVPALFTPLTIRGRTLKNRIAIAPMTDEYGGSFENRTRLIVRICERVRAAIPDELPLFTRLSATDYVEEGWTVDDHVKLSQLLKDVGVDLIDCSSGANTRVKAFAQFVNYQVPFAERVVNEVGVLAGAVGLITDPVKANKFIEDKRADLVLIGRVSLREPNWPIRAAKELGYEVPTAPQYKFGYNRYFIKGLINN